MKARSQMDANSHESNNGNGRPEEVQSDSCITHQRCSFMVLLIVSFVCSGVSPLHAAEVARVGDAVVTTDQLRQTIARQSYNIYEEASVKKALEDVIRFELLAAEARRVGLDKEPELQRRIKELLVEKLVREKVDTARVDVKFTEAELRAYYDSHTNNFRQPTVVRGPVLTIYLKPENQEEAHRKAADALRDWKAGETTEAVLRKYSDDSSERVGGAQGSSFVEGQASRRYPEEVTKVMFSLKLRGEVAGPIETSRAIYLVSLAERRDGARLPFEQVRRDIERLLGQHQREKAYTDYCESLKKQFPVSVNEAELKKAIGSTSGSARPPAAPVDPP
jgi:peptidyl-prolyl cis-trans isomerase C